MSGSEVLFNGLNASGQYELWAIKPGGSVSQITNVTGANTSTGLDPGDLTVFGTKVYFSGLDAAGNVGLWETNGTSAGTQELNVLGPRDLTVVGNELWFFGSGGLWETDGTAAGTHLLVAGLNGSDMTVFNGKVMFAGTDGGLWETDGSSGGTQEIAGTATAGTGLGSFASYNFSVAPGGLQPLGMVVLNGELVFSGSAQLTYTNYANNTYTIPSQNVMAYNGSSIQIISPYYAGSDVTDFTGALASGLVPGNPIAVCYINEGLSHSAYDPVAMGFYQGDYTGFWGGALDATDGSSNTIVYGENSFLVSGQGTPDPNDIIAFNANILFNGANDAGTGNTLWLSSGPTPADGPIVTEYTVCLGSLVTGEDISGLGLNPQDMVEFDNTLYFNGTDAAGHANLWGYDFVNTYFEGNQASAAEVFLSLEGGELNVSGESPNGLDPDMLAAPYTPITAATAAQYTADPASVSAPDFSYGVTDTAANIEALTPTQLSGLSGVGATGIVATDASLAFTVLQAVAIEDPVYVSAPAGDTVTVTDTAAAIEAMTPAEIAALWTSGFTGITATDASVVFSVAQAVALQPGALVVSVPTGDSVSVSDTAAAIEALTADQIAMLALSGITAITATDASVVLTIAQALALDGISLHVGVPQGDTVTFADTAADIEALTSAQITALAAYGITTIAATDASVAIGVTEALALAGASIKVTVPAGDAFTVADVIANVAYLSPAQIAAMAAIGLTITIADTAANIETMLAAGGLGGLLAQGVTAIAATNASVVLTIAEAQALQSAPFPVTVPAGDTVSVADTIAHVVALSPAQIAALAAQGLTITVADTAANIEALTADQMTTLAADGVTAIAATDASLVFTVAEATAFVGTSFHLTAPAGDTVAIADIPKHVDTLSPTQIAALATIGVNAITSSGTVALIAARAVALEDASLAITGEPNGSGGYDSVTVHLIDLAAAIEALTPAQIAALPATGVSEIVVTDAAVTLSVAQAEAIAAASLPLSASPYPITIADTAANIESFLASGQLGAVVQYAGISAITANDATAVPVVITAADAVALEGPPTISIASSNGTVTFADTAADIEALTPAQIAKLAAYGVTAIAVTDASVALTVAQVAALDGAALSVTVPSHDTLTVADTAANIEAMTAGQIAALVAYGVTAIAANNASLLFTVAEAQAIAGTPFLLSAQHGDVVAIADSYLDIPALSAAQIAALPARGLTAITSWGPVTLTAAQAVALEAVSLPITAEPGDGLSVAVTDTAAAIEALTPAQIAALPAIGVQNGITATGAAVTLGVAQIEAIVAAQLGLAVSYPYALTIADSAATIESFLASGQLNAVEQYASISNIVANDATAVPLVLTAAEAVALEGFPMVSIGSVNGTVSLEDTAAHIEALTPTQLSQLGVPAITSNDASIVFTVAQAEAVTPHLYVNVPSGHTVSIVDTATNLEALLASGNFADVTQFNHLAAIAAYDASVALTVAEAVLLEDTNGVAIPVSAPAGDSVTLADTAADIATLTPAQIAALPRIGVTAITIADSESGIDTLTAAQIAALRSMGATEIIEASLTGTGSITIAGGMTLAVTGPVSATQTIDFAAPFGVLDLGDPADMGGTISGFAPGDTIDVPGAAYDATAVASLGADNLLTVTEESGTYTLQFDPAQYFLEQTFVPGPAAGGGTAITLVQVPVTDYEPVPSGLTVLGVVVGDGGTVDDSGTLDGGIISSGGTAEIESGALTEGITIDNGGTEVVYGGGTLDSAVINGGGLLDLADGGAGVGSISFGTLGGTLQIAATTMPAATISAFAAGDTIDLGAVAYDATGGASLGANNLLAIVENGSTYDLQLDPSQYFLSEDFVLGSDGASGTDITLVQVPITDVETVASGQTVDGVTVGNGGTVTVQSGGTLNDALVSSGGLVNTQSGGAANFTTVSNGGYAFVSGTTVGTTVSSGGHEEVYSGGMASATTLSEGGIEWVFDGGTASGVTVSNGGDAFVYYSGTILGATVSSGGVEIISNGGAASGTTVDSAGYDVVRYSGLAAGTTLSNGGVEVVSYGGVASASLVSSGGYEVVSNGGAAVDTTVSNGGAEYVYLGGTTSGTTVSGGGVEYVHSAGTASGTVLSSDGVEFVFSTGTASGTVINSGGAEFVFSGGAASGTVVDNGGALIVFPDATAIGTSASVGGAVVSTGVVLYHPPSGVSVYENTATGTTVSSGGVEFVLPSGIAISTTVSDGGYAYVESAGVASGATVSYGGYAYVESGGTASGTVLSNGGEQDVWSAGSASFTTVSNGGAEVVHFGGEASGTAVRNGGHDYVLSDGSASFTTVSTGGVADVLSGGTASGTVVSAGGVVNVSGGYTYIDGVPVLPVISSVTTGTTVEGGGIEYLWQGGVASSTTVDSGGYEVVSSGGTALGTTVDSGGVQYLLNEGVSVDTSVMSGGAIDVAYLPYAPGGSASVNSSGLLTASVDGYTYTQQLAPSDAGQIFNVAPDGYGATLLIGENIPCYLAGTRIATTRGAVAVESLRIGDHALSAFGGFSEIVWTGHRAVDCARHPVPADVLPVCIRAGAFAPGLPVRDLRLSPDHAVFVDLAGDGGVLIPARYLVNGRTIVQEAAGRITYWHVECAQHDVLLAEGLPAESYLDTGNRSAFAEAGVAALHPDFAINAREVWEQFACRPLVEAGPALDAARAHLAARAAAMGLALPPFQDVEIDRAGLISAVVPPRAERVHLRSPCLVPAGERRRLGVAIGAIALDGIALSLRDPGLDSGFYALEPSAEGAYRWTDGEGVLRLTPSDQPRVLTVQVLMLVRGSDGAARAA